TLSKSASRAGSIHQSTPSRPLKNRLTGMLFLGHLPLRLARSFPMSMGRRQEQRQADLWIATTDLPQSPGHVFYDTLNRLLADAGFDRFAESLCEPYYAVGMGRNSIPPGTYFRMLFV